MSHRPNIYFPHVYHIGIEMDKIRTGAMSKYCGVAPILITRLSASFHFPVHTTEIIKIKIEFMVEII
jgi:hypothetical protein